MAASPIYYICPRDAWESILRGGAYHGSRDDRRDGFIHFSTADQVAESAARHRAGQAGLVLLTVDPERLGPALRWETSRGGALFPHLYAPLTGDAVTAVQDLPLDKSGRHVFPPLPRN